MSRLMCLSLVVLGLAAAPGCSSCFGGGSSCRRPSFMEFGSPCGRRSEPCGMSHAPAYAPVAAPACGPAHGPACGPACGDPCGAAVGAGPCCNDSGVIFSSPSSAPMSSPMALPPAESVPAPAPSPQGTFS